jgi:poly-gamma-glutamate synthesis protein (capsule biosynthesis protein)
VPPVPRLPTAVPPTAEPTATSTPTPLPTATPEPFTSLGLRKLWEWKATDILCAFLVRDLDGDGRPEVVAGSYDRRLYLVDATGQERWAYDTGGSVFSLDVADIDGDGLDEILAGSEDGGLRLLTVAGELRWEVSLPGRVTAVAALDLDANGTLEIVVGARPGTVWALRGDGTVLWQRDIPGAPTAFVLVGAVENRGVAMGTEDGALLALDPQGVPLWETNGGGYIRGLAATESGVLAGARTGSVLSLTMDGRPLLEAALEEPVPIVANVDLDGDGTMEVLAGTRSALVTLDAAGQERWRVPTERGVWALAFPDLEGDGRPEIVAGTDGGEILVLDRWGRVRGHTYVPFRVHGLLAADLNADGRDEVLARASNYLYVFFGSPDGEEGEQQPLVATLPEWPVDTPLFPASEGQVVLMAVGDVMLGRAVEPRALMYGPEFPFAPLIPLLRQGDIVTGNMEGVIGYSGTPLEKSFAFRAHPAVIAGLQAAGFNLVTLANNHARDFGAAGMSETMALLESAGIRTVGAGPEAYAPVFVEVKGLKIAFLARNEAIARQDGVAWAEEGELRAAVAQAKAQADLVVVHLHAGIEYSLYADETQRRLAQAAADGGAALVIGHHSHSLQEVEWIGDTLVAYSLGDFVFDIDDHDVARDAVVLRVVLSRDGVIGAEWIPAHIVDDVQPQPVTGDDGRPVVKRLER